MERTTNCLAKLERMNRALRHEEPDRVPISVMNRVITRLPVWEMALNAIPRRGLKR